MRSTYLIAAVVALAIPLAAMPWSETDVLAQDDKAKRKKSNSKSSDRKPSPPPASKSSGGYPSCNQGVLWVDTLCRLDDGRVCLVGEFDITDCK
ncbi:MAG TPA: hypothetical protein PK264_18510 [Hyphomicrobiaceae bacterium]|nr:hypothetical protein [Hyphomicrobiaceae bacterium]